MSEFESETDLSTDIAGASLFYPTALAISDFQKFLLTAGANQHYSDLVPSLRGALRNVINAGRDAVDAAAPLTNGADAYGQVVWF